ENILNALELASQYHFSDLLIRGVCLYYPILKNQGLFDHLKRWLLEVKHIVEGSNDFSRRLKILLYLTEIHEVHGEYCRAEETGQEGLQLFADHHSTDYETYQAFMVVLAHIEIFRGRYDHARKYLLQGLNLPEEERNVEQTCHLFRLMGVVMDFQSHTQQAQVYWYKALTLARILGKEDVLIRILGSLGAGLARQELYKEAKEHLIEGLDLAQKYQYLSEISNFHLDLGDIAVIHNEYDIAEFHLQKSLLLAQQLQLQPTLSVALATLGELELKRGHEQQAQAYFQEGLVLARQKGNNDYVGAILSVQAEILLQKNELEGAKETFFEALRCIPADNTLYIATARYGLARVLIALDQRADAIEQATISLLLFQERKSSKAQEVQAWLEEHNSLPPTNGDQKTSFSRI
ncbi:MAG TPA: hypothetical protein VFN35_26040, partial [Ktedonobacteraceae bacterium]|nr:hypothetical protein [Ktedonobacteraceae bacterium]